ncbi:MAG TPA: dihydrolipoamide succinyltransferase, partial [Alphaproteobacteria bacterium]|nr:dihydrolipoamide succinyltransferase [Alphaproteobacteria bacterium]
MTQIVVPTLGESVSEATVAQWLKKEGDTVAMDEPIVELETDKVTLEVNAPSAGVISSIIVKEGENVEVGALLGEIGGEGSAANDSKPAPAKEEPKAAAAPAPAKAAEEKQSPAVTKMVNDNNL